MVKNYDEAIKWFIKAAELGDIKAQMLLVKLYREGKVIPQDTEKSIYWFKKVMKGKVLRG